MDSGVLRMQKLKSLFVENAGRADAVNAIQSVVSSLEEVRI